MSLPQIYTDPGSFGKDSYVPFIGQVEDVDDPKRSGRVKVRIIGCHPQDKGAEGLTTEQLPWARCAMPVTHAQQSRIGGKHGLIVGSMVIGFFLDGMDQQDPVVTHAFSHTAKASTENNRKKVDVGEGKIPKEIKGHTKVSVVDNNSGIATKEEMTTGQDYKGDIAHDAATLDDSTNGGSCAMDQSAFSETKVEELKPGNPHSQLFNVPIADGLCGALMNGRAIIADEINKLMPDGTGILVEGSDLFDINGNIINTNAIINRLSTLIAGQLKYSINTNKAFIQKTINKPLHSLGIFAGSSRNPMTAQLADQVQSVKYDILNSVIDIFVGSLDGIVSEAMTSIYKQKLDSKVFNNSTGEGGAEGVSVLLDLAPIEIADSVIADVELSYNLVDSVANATIEASVGGISGSISVFSNTSRNANEENYAGADDMNDDIGNQHKQVEDSIKNVSESSDQIAQQVNDTLGGLLKLPDSMGFQLSDISQFLMMVLDMDFTTNMQLFNKVGPTVLDLFTQDGCNPFDMFNTFNGYVGSMAGVGGQFDGGGSESGKSSKNDRDMYINSGFAGKPGETNEEDTTNKTIDGDPRVEKIGENSRKRIRERIDTFAPVDNFEDGRSYDLNGETTINGEKTDNSRVLVNNQSDPSENGIYVTSDGEWTRASDADDSSDFSDKKLVEVKSLNGEQRMMSCSSGGGGKLGYDEIKFEKLSDSDEFTQREKNAFDDKVRIIPDGSNAAFFLASRPSSDEEAAKNYVAGIPNVAIISKPGRGYFYTSRKSNRNFPSVAIQGYAGTPRPVVDPDSGELVMVLVNFRSFHERRSNPSASIFADDSSKGVSTADPNYEVFLSGFYIANTGVGYSKETTIKVIDKDRDMETAQVRPRVRDGRITFIEVINTGSGFKRIPKIKVENSGSGSGLKIYPMMGLRAVEDNEATRKLQKQVALSLPPST